MRNVTRLVSGLVAVLAVTGNAGAQPGPDTTPAPQQPAPYPQQPAPYPQQPAPYPQQPPPYPQQPPPYPQQPAPYPQQPPPYPGQPAPYPQQPAPYPGQPAPSYQLSPQPLVPPQPYRTRRHDGAIILDFALVGTLAASSIISRQDIDNASAGTFIVLAGIAGGGAFGWLLSDKYDVDAGTSHATTIGLLAGIANGALLIEPFDVSDGDSILTMLLVGSAVGAGGGFVYGQASDLTSGQALFLGNAVMLGVATASITAIAGSDDGEYGGWENGTLALGLDGGLLAGALIAPHLDWSPRRARVVFAATAVGALTGGMLAGLIADKRDDGADSDYNGDLIAACMTAGLWGGFGLAILTTRGAPPDPRYGQPPGPVRPRAPAATPAPSVGPLITDRGHMGLTVGGFW